MADTAVAQHRGWDEFQRHRHHLHPPPVWDEDQVRRETANKAPDQFARKKWTFFFKYAQVARHGRPEATVLPSIEAQDKRSSYVSTGSLLLEHSATATLDSDAQPLPPPEDVSQTQEGVDRYYAACEDLNLLPTATGLVRRHDYEVNLRGQSLGDSYATALAKCDTFPPGLQSINLRGNRLTDRGAATLGATLPSSLERLDLSDNHIGAEGVTHIGRKLAHMKTLQVLRFADNKLGDLAVDMLCTAISNCQKLRELDLSCNGFKETGAKAVAMLVADHEVLAKLDLHWNEISGAGGLALANALMENAASNGRLRDVNLAWNNLGSGNAVPTCEAFARIFSERSTLRHLDISYNKLDAKCCSILAEGLQGNHSLFDLHVAGNAAYVDAIGFLVPVESADDMPLQRCTSISGGADENCWVSVRWTEQLFEYTAMCSGPAPAKAHDVWLLTSFDHYKPIRMMTLADDNSEDKRYVICRAVPPGRYQYFFQVDDEAVAAIDNPVIELDEPVSVTLEPIEEGEPPKKTHTKTVNVGVAPLRPKGVDIGENVQPRKLDTPISVAEVQQLRPRVPSLFASYRLDTNDLLNKCFEEDWRRSKLNKYVKDVDTRQRLKEILRPHYNSLRLIYKHFAALEKADTAIPALALNDFTEILETFDIIDDRTCKLKDGDMVFIAANVLDKGDGHGDMTRPDHTHIIHVKNPLIVDNSLMRFQWLEAIVRLADQKYKKSGDAETLGEAMEILLESHILPYEKDYRKPIDWRTEELFTEAVQQVYSRHMKTIRAAFDDYAMRDAGSGLPPYICLPEFNAFCEAANALDGRFTAREVSLAFTLAMMTQVNETDKRRHLEMSFVEFLEAVGRIVYMREGYDSAQLPALLDSFLANNVATRVPPAKPAEGDEEEEGQANDPAEETDTDSPQAAAPAAEGEADTPHE
ncbi:unnamed protein product [Vitrella brassicaformis CCMP3155]|uniref:Uncharacterized protein n=1 Tax=Vitrella brassicaformis (strain CCMP3155) TaxID=1169540 RepID=A0A0G4H6G6_VITBC|nr:unnamed protein product [Vitrella brassicaformis CCMP3155]|eukprot:CEM39209.1 unnamed protein product [Vitrella brassicaformis CCMP3155]